MREEPNTDEQGVPRAKEQCHRHTLILRPRAAAREGGSVGTGMANGADLKIVRIAADDWCVTTPPGVAGMQPGERAAARQQFSEIELAHALRATAAQQLRLVAVAHRQRGGAARTAELEQAIADRIERIVEERRRAATRASRQAIDADGLGDELAVRRNRHRRDPGGRALA